MIENKYLSLIKTTTKMFMLKLYFYKKIVPTFNILHELSTLKKQPNFVPSAAKGRNHKRLHNI